MSIKVAYCKTFRKDITFEFYLRLLITHQLLFCFVLTSSLGRIPSFQSSIDSDAQECVLKKNFIKTNVYSVCIMM